MVQRLVHACARGVMIAAALALFSLLPAAAHAQVAPAVIAFVNMQEVATKSAVFLSVRQQLEARSKQFKTELDGQFNTLKNDVRTVATGLGVKLSADPKAPEIEQFMAAVAQNEEVATKNKGLLDKYQTFLAAYRQRNDMLAAGEANANQQIQPQLEAAVSEVAKAVGATIVMDSGRVMVSASSLDVTSQVIAQLNTRMPRITLNFTPPKR